MLIVHEPDHIWNQTARTVRKIAKMENGSLLLGRAIFDPRRNEVTEGGYWTIWKEILLTQNGSPIKVGPKMLRTTKWLS